jgi:hypothetical protein
MASSALTQSSPASKKAIGVSCPRRVAVNRYASTVRNNLRKQAAGSLYLNPLRSRPVARGMRSFQSTIADVAGRCKIYAQFAANLAVVLAAWYYIIWLSRW